MDPLAEVAAVAEVPAHRIRTREDRAEAVLAVQPVGILRQVVQAGELGLDLAVDVLGPERGREPEELRDVGAVETARERIAEQALGGHLAVDPRALENRHGVEVRHRRRHVRMVGVVEEIDVAQLGHPVQLDPLSRLFGAGERRRRRRRDVPGVHPLQLERQAAHRVGEPPPAAGPDGRVVRRLAAVDGLEQALVGVRVHLAERVVRQAFGIVADAVGVAVLVTVRGVQDQRLPAVRLGGLIADLVRRLAAGRRLGHLRRLPCGFRQDLLGVFGELRERARARGTDRQRDRRAADPAQELAAAQRPRRAIPSLPLLFSIHIQSPSR